MFNSYNESSCIYKSKLYTAKHKVTSRQGDGYVVVMLNVTVHVVGMGNMWKENGWPKLLYIKVSSLNLSSRQYSSITKSLYTYQCNALQTIEALKSDSCAKKTGFAWGIAHKYTCRNTLAPGKLSMSIALK